MFKRITLFIILFSFCVFAQMGNPKITVQNTDYDFGNVVEGTLVKHTFTITNTGNDLLKISNVQPSCGCTAAKPDKNELKPGESTKLKIEFNSEGRTGKQEKHIMIASNDPQNSSLNLKIFGMVEKKKIDYSQNPGIEFKETSHNFGKIIEGSKVDYTFSFTNKGKKTLEIKDVRTSCGCTAALISEKSIAPGKSGTIKIEFDSADRMGKQSKTIVVVSNDPGEPQKSLTIFAEIQKNGN